MISTFSLQDAYAQWLGIPTSELPPHHYRLLGIPAMESDTSSILSAYGARTSLLSARLAGEHAEIARRLLGELAAAQACLLNPDAKAHYDRALAARMGDAPSAAAATATPSPPGLTKRPAPRPKAETVDAPTAATAAAPLAAAGVLPYRDPGEPASALPWLIGGVCAGLLGVCALGLILFAFGDRKKPTDAQLASAGGATGSDQQQNVPRGDRHSNRPATGRPGGSEIATGDRVAPNINPATNLHWDKDPVGSARTGELMGVTDIDGTAAAGENPTSSTGTSSAEDPPAPAAVAPANPLASLPPAVRLPRRNVADAEVPAGPVVLTRIDVDKSEPVSIKLAASALAGGSGRYDLLPREAAADDADEGAAQMWDVQHTSANGQSNIVGAYELADGELSFAWSPDATAEEMAQLQNQPLEIAAGDFATTLSQRTPDEMPPMIVKVDSGAIISLASIESPPENAAIFLAVDELSSDFPEHQWEPASTIQLGKHTDLRFGAASDSYQLALRFTAESAGPNKVRIEARPMFREGDTQKWDYFRPKFAAQTLGQLKGQEALIDGQMEQLRRRYRRDPAALQQASAALNGQSTALQERIANLERISDACQAMQDKAQIHFRLYAKDGEQEIDLVRTAKEETADDQTPMPEIDPNIGAPIEAAPEPAPEEAPPAE